MACSGTGENLPITDSHLAYAEEIKKELMQKRVRCEIDSRNEKIGYKIRAAQLEKVPYMLVLGDKERDENKVAVRSRKEGDKGAIDKERFIAELMEEIEERRL